MGCALQRGTRPTGRRAQTTLTHVHGSFDLCGSHDVYTGYVGASRSISFGEVAHPGMSADFLLGDLRCYASVRHTQSDMPDFDLVHIPVPETSTGASVVLGLFSLVLVSLRLAAPLSRRKKAMTQPVFRRRAARYSGRLEQVIHRVHRRLVMEILSDRRMLSVPTIVDTDPSPNSHTAMPMPPLSLRTTNRSNPRA